MTLCLTTLSLPSMLAFAALHCLARASSLPMASFMASPHAEFVLTEPASAESDAPPHVKTVNELACGESGIVHGAECIAVLNGVA